MFKLIIMTIILSACSQAPVRPVIKSKGRAAPVTNSVFTPEVTSKDQKLIQQLAQKTSVVLDVRDVNDFVNGHVKGAINLDFMRTDFQERVNQLDPKKNYFIYCSTGNRSGKAMHYFTAKKLRVRNIGNFDDLKARGIPMEGVSER